MSRHTWEAGEETGEERLEKRDSTGRRGEGREVETSLGCFVFLDLTLSHITDI